MALAFCPIMYCYPVNYPPVFSHATTTFQLQLGCLLRKG